MADHIIKVTSDNYDGMLQKGVAIARSGLGIGFDLSSLDPHKRIAFNNEFNRRTNDLHDASQRRTALVDRIA